MPIRTSSGSLAAVVAASVLAGCSGGAGSVPSQNTSAQSAQRAAPLQAAPAFAMAAVPDGAKTLYVASRDNNQILGFPADANGNVAPTVTIAGAATKLGVPVGLTVAKNGKILAINDSGDQVLIFPAGSNGNVAPVVLGGYSSSPVFESEGVALDASGRIYVSSYSTNTIYVFAKNARGNAAPVAVISGANTLLSQPGGMAFDSAGDLYVANESPTSSFGTVVVEFAPNANGNATPIATLGGNATGLYGAVNVSLDPQDRIVVANNGGTSVSVFAPGSNGNVAPVATISGHRTMLTDVTSTGVDAAGRIYVTNAVVGGGGSILVFKPSANGNVKPAAVITGESTGIDDVFYPSFH